MLKKVLIANRGEIALRIHRACREMGIQTVAVHSTADAGAMHVRLADESVCIGPPPARDSYLNILSILSAAAVTGADAIHPGIGFLAERPQFAEIVREHGLVFIGPDAEHIRLMGDKSSAKQVVQKLGMKVVPGSQTELTSFEQAEQLAISVGYPILLKAVAGGGGSGMKVVCEPSDLLQCYQLASNEATAAFGDGRLYLERFLSHPHHIEVQVLADQHGNLVHLRERDCSIQRRHQKLVEESPSPVVTDQIREHITSSALEVCRQLGYHSAGTMEFLYEDGQFYFIEMNTRLQVEHTVSEMISGQDLVQEQIRIAAGEQLGFSQADLRFHGHAIECRINAEHPQIFTPSPGLVQDYHAPGGLGVRVDSALFKGYQIPPFYDSLIAKLVVHANSRQECLMRLRRALEEFVIGGVDTTLPLHRRLLTEEAFVRGDYDTHWLEDSVLAESS